MARGFYRSWASYMKGDKWDDLLGRNLPKKTLPKKKSVGAKA